MSRIIFQWISNSFGHFSAAPQVLRTSRDKKAILTRNDRSPESMTYIVMRQIIGVAGLTSSEIAYTAFQPNFIMI